MPPLQSICKKARPRKFGKQVGWDLRPDPLRADWLNSRLYAYPIGARADLLSRIQYSILRVTSLHRLSPADCEGGTRQREAGGGSESIPRYHRRSVVGTAFSMMMQAKFGTSIRSKTEIAQANDLLCKVLCHNICCVIQSMYELRIEAQFA